MRLSRAVSGIAVLAIVIGIVKGWLPGGLALSPLEDAYTVCDLCGLTNAEVDQFITNVRARALSREEELAMWRDIADPENVEACRPCVDAILDVSNQDAEYD